jgi:hypothetical protein
MTEPRSKTINYREQARLQHIKEDREVMDRILFDYLNKCEKSERDSDTRESFDSIGVVAV